MKRRITSIDNDIIDTLPNRLLTPTEVMEFLGYKGSKASFIKNYLSARPVRIASIKVGRQRKITRKAVKNYLIAMERKANLVEL